ncbi:F-box/kelch-repeat protein SKIP6-like [Cornus florida]|uniref:F-box/kelch-repeat protein SKIP6-like n=1 Tax=Cornus florida TaxID=4283 RepID=UPI00289F8A07|nr:F-box/kelch-repeat protein SKIP6-like [Cornus florida]XP_059624377.1 F-box/kelch-repeat protein SKIP6-like [Cornus florida]XP_059624378.1 F-box/kelch-repeat protein SKIP6-like [Cornus florida]
MTGQTFTTSEEPPPGTSNPPSATPLLLPNLPNDVALQCIARVPRYQHPYLSLVSKSWRSTIRSPLLFTTRSLLNCAQHFLFLNVRTNSSFNWYLLDQNPNPPNPKNARTLSLLPSIPFQPIGATFAVSGPKIYVIGGSINDIPSNNVWVFDCRFNRWEVGPKMRVGREFAAAGEVNGKIYVMGGCLVDNWARSMNWAELFDPMTGLWAAVPSPIEIRDKWMHASAVIYDKIYAMADRGGVVYDAVAAEWSGVPTGLDMGWRGRAAVVGGVLYCYDYLGKIRGYDMEEDEWKELKGVEKGLPTFLCGATMANLGGRLCVVWERKGTSKVVEIMCAEIEVRKDRCGGLSGSIVWSDVILVVPDRSSIVQCLPVGL